ncbi:MAG TPA: peptidylprolyl isomerase [Acidimicrobiales bacterium]|nr:peptidylprolyl isomerase [Acidimicrobiales bacterium]
MKRIGILALLATVAAGAGACDLSPPAASVGSATVTRAQLDSQLSAIAGSPYAQCALQLQGVGLPTPLTGVGDDTVNTTFANYELNVLVVERVIDQALAARHQSVTAADLQAARADLQAELTPSSGGSSPCPGAVAGKALIGQLPTAFADEQVHLLADQERLTAVIGHVHLDQASLLAYYNAHSADYQEICLSDIAVLSQTQAQQIHDAIAAGTSTYAAEAAQNSIDTQTAANGGAVGCLLPSQLGNLQADIVALPQGQPSLPIEEPGGGPNNQPVWFVFEVDGRRQVPFSQAAPQIRQQLLSSQSAAVSAEFSRLARAADVTVDPRYGTWSSTQGIRPPVAPPADTLLSSTADTASAGAIG